MKPLDVTIVGGGMITLDLLLPSFYHLQRTGQVGNIGICALNNPPLKALAENPDFKQCFPGQTFTPHPALSEPPTNNFPTLYREIFAAMPKRQIAVVAMPDQLHYEVIMEAIKHDQHVLCVKPLVLRHEQAARKLCHNPRRTRFRVTRAVGTVAEGLAGADVQTPECPTCKKPTQLTTELIPQAPGKYVALSKCPQHGLLFIRVRFALLPDGRKGMHLNVAPANRQNRAYVHTKELQYQYRLKRGDYEHVDVEDLSAAYSSNMPFEDA